MTPNLSVHPPLNFGGGGGGVSDFGKLPSKGEIKILGGGVTGSRRGDIFRAGGCSFSLITFFNSLRN